MERENDLWLDTEAFEDLVVEALDGLPEEFAGMLDNVAVVIEEEPGPEVREELGMAPEDDLFGLYQGIPLADRDTYYSALPDRVAIYRRPILRWCRTEQEVIREVRDTVVHELGHHFGLDEEDMPY